MLELESLAKKIKAVKPCRAVIYCENTYLFALAFFASLSVEVDIVIPQTRRPSFLKEVIQSKDVVLHDTELNDKDFSEIFTLNPQKRVLKIQRESHRKLDQHDKTKLLLTDKSVLEKLLAGKITFFTSGSNGLPKPIQKNFSHLVAEVNVLDSLWGEQIEQSVFLSSVTHQHIYGMLFRLLWPLTKGHFVFCSLILSPEELSAASQKFAKKIFISSPAFLKRLTQVDFQEQLLGLQAIFSSGNILQEEHSLICKAIFAKTPIEVLGSTETGGIAFRQRKKTGELAWQILPEVTVKTKPETMELMIKSPFCASEDFVLSGDLAEGIDQKTFLLKGRIDNIVKLEGKRVSINEVENSLLKHNYIKSCKAVPIRHFRESLGMLVELNAEGQTFLDLNGKAELIKLLREYLKEFVDLVALPRKWRFLQNIPTNSSGKTVQIGLQELFKSG